MLTTFCLCKRVNCTRNQHTVTVVRNDEVITLLKIVESPDPLLNQTCEPCDVGDPSLADLSTQMFEAMYANDGVGLAAPQVGILKRLVVIDCGLEDDPEPLVLINPELLETWGDWVTDEEGCLSCPGISVPIKRKEWARVRYYDLEGSQWEIEGDGLLGRCLQHELDHLEGITLFERCSPLVRLRALAAYDEARKAGAKPGQTSIPQVR